MKPYTHPHPNPKHVMERYRSHILGWKRKTGSARGLVHYRAIVEEYLAAKRLLFKMREVIAAHEKLQSNG